jgi:hypothetical protein
MVSDKCEKTFVKQICGCVELLVRNRRHQAFDLAVSDRDRTRAEETFGDEI